MTDTEARLSDLTQQLGAGQLEVMEWYERYDESLRTYLLERGRCTRDDIDKIADEAFIHLCFARASGPIKDPKEFLFTTARLLENKIHLRDKPTPRRQ